MSATAAAAASGPSASRAPPTTTATRTSASRASAARPLAPALHVVRGSAAARASAPRCPPAPIRWASAPPAPSPSCGADGFCDGKGGCEIYSKATVCQDPTCAVGGSIGTAAAHCDGAGTCAAAATISCNEYMCGTNGACLVSCKTNADCSPGNVCNGGICGKKVLGVVLHRQQRVRDRVLPAGRLLRQGLHRHLHGLQPGQLAGALLAASVRAWRPPASARPPIRPPAATTATATAPASATCRSTGTICKVATCSTAVQTLAARCDGMGTCVNGTTQPCDPFQCGTNGACLGTCNPANGNADCTTGNVCTPNASMPATGSCGKKPLGAAVHAAQRVRVEPVRGRRLLRHALLGHVQVVRARRQHRQVQQRPRGPGPAGSMSDRSRSRPASATGSATATAPAATTRRPPCAWPVSARGATFTTPRTCDGAGTCAPATTGTCPGSFACDTANRRLQDQLLARDQLDRLRLARDLQRHRLRAQGQRRHLRRRQRVRDRLLRAGRLLRQRLPGHVQVVRVAGRDHAGRLLERAARRRWTPAARRPRRRPAAPTASATATAPATSTRATTQCAAGLCPSGTANQTNPRSLRRRRHTAAPRPPGLRSVPVRRRLGLQDQPAPSRRRPPTAWRRTRARPRR